MATAGDWNIAGINLPDFGITEALGIGSPNTLVTQANAPGYNYGPAVKGASDQQASLLDRGDNQSNTINNGNVYVPQGNSIGVTPVGGGQTQLINNPNPSGQPKAPSAPSNANGQVPYAPSFDGQTIGMNGRTYRAVNGVWQDVTPNQDDLVNQAYNPTMDYLNQLQSQLQGNQQQDINDVNSRYQTYMDRLPTEQAQGQAELDQNKTQVDQTLRSAYDQAVRAYNSLKQTGIAKYGAGSSAGQALGELANQEYFRQQGNVANQGIQASQQFAAQKQKLTDYITQKSDDLRLQKEDALKQLDRNLQQNLAQINQNKAQTEQAKAQMKLQLIQSSMAQAQQIQAADTAFKQNLALSLVQNLQQVSGQQFTPQQVVAQIQPIMNMLNGQTQQTPGATPALQGGNILSGNNQDQLQGGNILSSAIRPQDLMSTLGQPQVGFQNSFTA